MSVLTVVSPLSAWLVMLSLGLGATTAERTSWRHELAVRYWLGIYVLPLLLIGGLMKFGGLIAGGALGLALCVLSGSGTSGVAWARARGASGSRVTTRLASGALIALVTMPLTAALGAVTVNAMQVSFTVFMALILAQWLPWKVGRWWSKHRPIQAATLKLLERAASLSVVVLIIAVAWQAFPSLLQHPKLAFSAAMLAILLAATSAFEADEKLEAMGVVRNLTLVTLVLIQADAPAEAMTALAAFGAVMYPAAWLSSSMSRISAFKTLRKI